MAISESAKAYRGKMLPGYRSALEETDPEFMERFCSFAYDEVVNQDDLDHRTRFMAILAALLGCQGVDGFRLMLPAALPLEPQATNTAEDRVKTGEQAH